MFRNWRDFQHVGDDELGGAVFGVFFQELVEDGVNGWKFEAQSADSISETLKKMAALGPDERDHMGKESLRILQERAPTKAFGEGLAKLLGVTRTDF